MQTVITQAALAGGVAPFLTGVPTDSTAQIIIAAATALLIVSWALRALPLMELLAFWDAVASARKRRRTSRRRRRTRRRR